MKNIILGGNFVRSTQHATYFNPAVLANEDMTAGMYILYSLVTYSQLF